MVLMKHFVSKILRIHISENNPISPQVRKNTSTMLFNRLTQHNAEIMPVCVLHKVGDTWAATELQYTSPAFSTAAAQYYNVSVQLDGTISTPRLSTFSVLDDPVLLSFDSDRKTHVGEVLQIQVSTSPSTCMCRLLDQLTGAPGDSLPHLESRLLTTS